MKEAERTRRRKNAHIDLCVKRDVEFRQKSAWFEYVDIVHQAYVPFSLEQIDLSTSFLGKNLRLPFLIGAMTGGCERGRRVNRQLAEIAQELGVGMVVGSQRAMVEAPSLAATYAVRDVAPDILLLANLGLRCASNMTLADVTEMVNSIGADGLALYLNNAMELAQRDGEPLLPPNTGTIRALASEFGPALVVKETGCGISRDTAQQLKELGVRTVDTAGAGGTSWARVEILRGGYDEYEMADLEEWGIPTAASLCEVRGLGLDCIVSGGVRSGFDLAKGLALGASAGSSALPVLRELVKNGPKNVVNWVRRLASELRTAMFLAGAATADDLRSTRIVLQGPLLEWLRQRDIPWTQPPSPRT